MGGKPVDLLPLKQHRALRAVVDARDHVKQRGLARSVGADDPVDAALRHIDRYIVGCRDTTKTLHDVL